LGTKCSSDRRCVLVATFWTIQDLTAAHPPRTAGHFREMRTAYQSSGKTLGGLGLDTHLSIERTPVIIVPPSQIVPLPLHLLIGLTLRMLRLAIEAVTQARGVAARLQFSHTLTAVLSVKIGVEAVPYHGGNLVARHCHAIASRSDAVVRALRSLLPTTWLASYERVWTLFRGLMSTLNGTAIIPLAEKRQFKIDARAFARLLQVTFPWVSISPKLHVLCFHTWEFMGLWGSTGLYGEQDIESWHGFYNQNTARFTAETPLLSCRKLVQTMALIGSDSDAPTRAKATTRKRRHGPRKAIGPGDRRLRRNKPCWRECLETLENTAADRAKWAIDQFDEANQVIVAFSKKS